MKNYTNIAAKITETPWLITQGGLDALLSIASARLSGSEPWEAKVNKSEFHSPLRQAAQMAGDFSSSNEYGKVSYNVKGVGVLPVMGPIFGRADMLSEMSGAASLESLSADLEAMLADDTIKSVLLDMDSPGGSADMVQEMGDLIYQGRNTKPIYALANNTSGSAAYWLMSQATQAFSTPSGLVGSVGAYSAHQDQSVSDAQRGVRFTYVSAGEHKVEGNPHEPLSNDARAYMQEVIDELYGDFTGAVARGRGISVDKVISDFGGGRMMTARKAQAAGLIDGIKSYKQLMGELQSIAATSSAPAVRPLAAGGAIAGSVNFGNLTLTSTDGAIVMTHELQKLIKSSLESKEYEHSPAGEGSPPPPRTDDDGSDDPAIVGGWRRDPLPTNVGDSGAATPNPSPTNNNAPAPSASADQNKGGLTLMNDEQIAELCKLLGCEPAQLTSVVTDMHAQTSALKTAVQMASETERLKEQFPELYKQHMELVGSNRVNAASAFVESNRVFTKPAANGEGFVTTDRGLSALAMDSIKDTHMKFADGSVSLEDFEKCVQTIMTGTVQYGELGSSRAASFVTGADNAAPGTKQAGEAFAAEVAKIQAEKPDMKYMDAVTEAARLHPEMAAAWRQPPVVGTNSNSAS